ncbi:MAG TPA: hypothetical protein VK504_25690 [Vicinamibacterales bacterium]|jgi:hypothetical protein|nr:hypothetical protein [Vicinamibacterales bacterium]
MPITRTAIIDDDGSGKTGTVIDNAWKQELYNQIDGLGAQALTTLALGPSVAVAVAGVMANLDPAGGAAIVWMVNAAAPGAYITGIKAPTVNGTQHLLINSGGNAIVLSNAHAASAVANRLIGPGYADYTLGPWMSAWVYYANAYTSWIVQKP